PVQSLPDATAIPSTERTRGSEVFPLRQSPPATGRAAEVQFRGLMDRIKKRQDVLTALPNAPTADRVVVLTSMKNEGCFILEWVAYHLSIGVTHFLVYTNDCDDPTNAVLDRLQTLGIVTRLDNPFNRALGQKPQRGALNDAIKQTLVKDADWVGVIDVDEFVNIHVGDGTFHDLLRAANDPNVLSMTWRFFGNKGVHGYQDVWQTEQLTACAPLYIPKPRLGWGFKTFFRPDAPFNKIGVHRPLELVADRINDVRWVNGAGRVMPDRVILKNEWFSRKDTIGYDLVTLNHYVLRSAESFLVKRQRGRATHVDQDQGFAYWSSRNYATETDRSIHRHLPRAKARLDALLSDKELRDLHRLAVQWHKDRIVSLLKEKDYRTLFDAITDPSLPDAIWRDRASEENTGDLDAAE
ncbi:MAG: glycosyltransferase family 2 protein, partial [Pseudomonadota bacterium]